MANLATAQFVNTRTGVGAGIGGVIGGVFAGPLGAAVGAVVGGTLANAALPPKRGVITARRSIIFQRALAQIRDPSELRKLALAFRNEGLSAQAEALEKRAKLRELPKDVKEMRRSYFRKAMASDDVDVIRKVSVEFTRLGAFDAGKELRDHADAVQAAHTAGKSAKPLAAPTQEQFAGKLEQALIHFGPQSKQAQTAAANLISSKGKPPTAELVGQVLALAWNAVQKRAAAAAPPAQPAQPAQAAQEEAAPAAAAAEETAAPPADAGDGAAVETVDAATAAIDSAPLPEAAAAAAADVAGPPTGAPEPTVVGPAAPVIEQPADTTETAAAEVIPPVEASSGATAAGETAAAPVAPARRAGGRPLQGGPPAAGR